MPSVRLEPLKALFNACAGFVLSPDPALVTKRINMLNHDFVPDFAFVRLCTTRHSCYLDMPDMRQKLLKLLENITL